MPEARNSLPRLSTPVDLKHGDACLAERTLWPDFPGFGAALCAPSADSLGPGRPEAQALKTLSAQITRLSVYSSGHGSECVRREVFGRRSANMEILRGWLAHDPKLSSSQTSQKFAALGIQLGDSAIRKYRKALPWERLENPWRLV